MRRQRRRLFRPSCSIGAVLLIAGVLLTARSSLAQTFQNQPLDPRSLKRRSLGPEDYMKTARAIAKLRAENGAHSLSASFAPCGQWVPIGPFGDVQHDDPVRGHVNGR